MYTLKEEQEAECITIPSTLCFGAEVFPKDILNNTNLEESQGSQKAKGAF